MFYSIPLVTAFIGSTVAAIYDLKTTEIPDEIPYIMIAIGLLFFGYQSYLIWDYNPILNSLIAGLGLLAFGFLMYYTGQWGGGDAKLLSAIGFLIPQTPQMFPQLFFPFPVSYLINVFLVGAAYMIIYSIVLAILNRKIIAAFSKDVKASSKVILIGSVILFTLFFGINSFLIKYLQLTFDFSMVFTNSLIPLAATVGLFVIWKFAKNVETVGFRKRIPVSHLKVGDVLNDSKLWEGITEKELKSIKRSGKKFVIVKEGIRFGPSFVLALLFTLYYGDGILLFMRFVI